MQKSLGGLRGVTPTKIEIIFYKSIINPYLGKVKKLQGLSMCFKRFTAKYVVGGADSSPPGWNKVKQIKRVFHLFLSEV